jgi:hypothetical protein
VGSRLRDSRPLRCAAAQPSPHPLPQACKASSCVTCSQLCVSYGHRLGAVRGDLGRVHGGQRRDVLPQPQLTIIVHEDVTLSVTAFSTELWYDSLTVNDEQYDGTSGPEGVHVAAGSTIYFASDGAVTSSGFEICGAPPNVGEGDHERCCEG